MSRHSRPTFGTMKEISISEVLALIKGAGEEETFALKIVRSTGKAKGSIGFYPRVRYGKPRDRGAAARKAARNGDPPPWLHTDRGTIPLTDTDRNRYIAPLISHIIQYNQYRVRH